MLCCQSDFVFVDRTVACPMRSLPLPRLQLTLLFLIGLPPILLPLIYIIASVLADHLPAVGGNCCELVAVCYMVRE